MEEICQSELDFIGGGAKKVLVWIAVYDSVTDFLKGLAEGAKAGYQEG